MSKKRTAVIKKFVEEYISSLEADNFFVQKAFVFGSRVKGENREDSDLDVAIVSSNIKRPFMDNVYLLRKAHELERQDFYIEPHGFHPKRFVDENPTVWEIKKTGIKIL